MRFYLNGKVEGKEEAPSRNENEFDIVLKVKRERMDFADTIRFFSGPAADQVKVRPGQSALVVFEPSTGRTQNGNPYMNGVFAGVAANTDIPPDAIEFRGWPAHRDLLDGAQPHAEPRREAQPNREEGLAYGAAQHAISRVVSAWVISHGELPDPVTMQTISDTIHFGAELLVKLRG
jgi:hypothetical protein